MIFSRFRNASHGAHVSAVLIQLFLLGSMLGLIGCVQPSSQSQVTLRGSGITGGSTTKRSDRVASSTVLLVVVLSSGDSRSISACTGTIISKDLVLTAGHCTVTDATAENPTDVYAILPLFQGDVDVARDAQMIQKMIRNDKSVVHFAKIRTPSGF